MTDQAYFCSRHSEHAGGFYKSDSVYSFCHELYVGFFKLYDSNERICIEGKLRIKYRGGYFVSAILLDRTRKITADEVHTLLVHVLLAGANK
jgi:hypothetical protein